jgi:hypothetical protein
MKCNFAKQNLDKTKNPSGKVKNGRGNLSAHPYMQPNTIIRWAFDIKSVLRDGDAGAKM